MTQSGCQDQGAERKLLAEKALGSLPLKLTATDYANMADRA
jgi:hypothetical protein